MKWTLWNLISFKMNISKQNNCLRYPELVGFMSVDLSREYHSDLSQLKFLNSVPNGQVYYDLNHKINEAVKRTSDDNQEKINLMLKFIMDQSSNLEERNCFVTYRRTLISIMCNAYHADHVCIIACLHKGSIYLCSMETPEQKQRRENRSVQEKKFCAWGYKFEQYMLSDMPNQQPDVQKPVIENEEFSLYFRSKLGNHELLYGAQIDGLLATNSKVPHPPNTNDFLTNLNYLKKNQYIELKTNREIHNQRQEYNFRKYKLLRCWCQCYLARLRGLLVGFRDDYGVVRRLQYFATDDIVNYCKREWKPEKALNYLVYFLNFIKTTFENKLQENKMNNLEPYHLQFEDYGNNSITVSECSVSSTDEFILPDWYLQAEINKT